MSSEILDLDDLESYRGKYIRFSRDSGQAWHYALVWANNPHGPDQRGAFRYVVAVYTEEGADATRLTDADFAQGIKVEAVADKDWPF